MSQTVTCNSFAFQEDAQAAYDADRTRLRNLDRDGDGVACEGRPRRGSVTPPPPGESSSSPTTTTTTTTTSTSPTSTTPTSSSSTPPTSTTAADIGRILGLVAAIQCENLSRDQGRILDELFALPLGTSQADRGRITDALLKRTRDLNCFGLPTASDSGVNPTDDDGSTATVSGDQVSDVPVGSAETGGV